MKTPEDVQDVYLKPGEFHWGSGKTQVRTLLGSCVSFCLWHPAKLIGGMCHYMLPKRGGESDFTNPDGRYAEEAMELFLRQIHAAKTKPRDYIVKIFGGATMSIHLDNQNSVSVRNVETAYKLVQQHMLNVTSENVGGTSYRKIHFEIWSGNVWLYRQDLKLSAGVKP